MVLCRSEEPPYEFNMQRLSKSKCPIKQTKAVLAVPPPSVMSLKLSETESPGPDVSRMTDPPSFSREGSG